MASVLRILAHELRSPAGVAQGYLKMVLDGRLPNPDEHRRALEHTQHAIERMSVLGREASEVASWLERQPGPAWGTVSLKAMLDSALERHTNIDASGASIDGSAGIKTSNEAALLKALTSLLAVVVREAPGTQLTLSASAFAHSATADKPARQAPAGTVDVALGAPHVVPELLLGPSAPGTGRIPLERGGLGLSLVMAVLVLEAHGIVGWTVNDQRAALGLRFPVVEGTASAVPGE